MGRFYKCSYVFERQRNSKRERQRQREERRGAIAKERVIHVTTMVGAGPVNPAVAQNSVQISCPHDSNLTEPQPATSQSLHNQTARIKSKNHALSPGTVVWDTGVLIGILISKAQA